MVEGYCKGHRRIFRVAAHSVLSFFQMATENPIMGVFYETPLFEEASSSTWNLATYPNS